MNTNHIIKIADDGQHFIKAIYFWILIVVAIFTNAVQLINQYVDNQTFKKDTIIAHASYEKRLDALENGYLSNRDILIEMRFNLKTHMIMAGQEYLDAQQINAIQEKHFDDK